MSLEAFRTDLKAKMATAQAYIDGRNQIYSDFGSNKMNYEDHTVVGLSDEHILVNISGPDYGYIDEVEYPSDYEQGLLDLIHDLQEVETKQKLAVKQAELDRIVKEKAELERLLALYPR